MSDTIAELKAMMESEDFFHLSEHRMTEIEYEIYVFQEVLTVLQSVQVENLRLEPINSDFFSVPHSLRTKDKYLNYAYDSALTPYDYPEHSRPETQRAIRKAQSKLQNIIRSLERTI